MNAESASKTETLAAPGTASPAVTSWTRAELIWLVVLLGTPLFEVLAYFLFQPGWGRLYLINTGQTFASLLCWVLMLRLGRSGSGDPALGSFWRILSFGVLAWFGGNLCFMTLQTVFALQAFPGWQDFLFLPAYLAMFFALFRLPDPARSRTTYINNLIEAAGLLLATMLVGWHFRLHEAFLLFLRQPALGTGYPLLYPLLDVALLWLLSLRARNQEGTGLAGGTLSWLIGGLFALIMADFSMPDILVTSPLQAGGSLSDLGWGWFSGSWGVAALLQLRRMRRFPGGQKGNDLRSRQSALLFLTSGWVLGMVLLLLHGLFTAEAGRRSAVLAVGVVAVLALVIARQIREVMDNENLNQLVAELEESRSQFRQLFQLFPDAALLSHLENGVFVEVNQGFSRIYGYNYEECVGQSGLDLNLWVDPRDRVDFIAALRRQGMVSQYESRARRRDGTILPVEMSARIVEFGGRQFLLNLVRDISDRRAAEEQLRRSEQDLRRAQKLEAIGGLAGGIAHDFNNLLTPIMGGTEMALLDLPAGHPVRSSLDPVLIASRRARDLVRQILSFSRRKEPQMQVVETGAVISEIIRLLQPQLPAAVQMRHLRRSPPAVMGDPTQLHQVFQNLCTNAVLALKDRPAGVIEIVEETFHADEAFAAAHTGMQARTYLRVAVRDTGCGMGPAVLERIFEPFFTTRRPGEGTGLGLAVVHGIIRAHFGTLTVYSSPGQGSIFHVYLPAALGVAPARAELGEKTLGKGEEIVCIDDDAAVLETVRHQLASLGYWPRVFNSPLEARDYLTGPDSARVAGIICDFSMPELDGITLAQEVSAKRSGLRWILASGYLSEETLQRARTAGLEHFIDKPPSLDELSAAIRRMLA